MRLRTACLCLVSFLCLLPGPALAAPPKLYIQDILPEAGVDPKVSRSLTDLLEIEIERGGLYTVVSQQDMRRLLRLERQRILMGDDENEVQRLSEIAKQLDAPYVLASSVGRVGEVYVLSLRLIDTAQVKIIRRINQTLVGEEAGLIGSLRAAALGLNLEQKGIAPDISEQLIDGLKIAEKEKTLFFSFSPAYEISLPGAGADDTSSILNLRPAYLHLRLDAEMPIWKYLRVFGSLSFGFTLAARDKQEVNNFYRITDPSLTAPIVNFAGFVADIGYSSFRIPFSIGIKIAPETGRFLPYGMIGIGLSWQKFSFSDSELGIFQSRDNAGSCQSPFTPSDLEEGIPSCRADGIQLESLNEIDSFGFDVIAAAGAEWLLTQHLGLKFEARYNMTILFKDSPDTWVDFEGQISEGDAVLETGYVTAIQHLHHGLMFSVGVIAYW